MNFLFERGKVSSSWKLGEIVPVHKKDCTLTKTNYRPITILPVLSKGFEKLVNSRLASHFEDVYHNNVFAYRDYHGCDTAILSLTEQFKKELDNDKVISMVSVWTCQKPSPWSYCQKAWRLRWRLKSYQSCYELFKWQTATCQIEWTTLFYENYNEGCPTGLNCGSHSL